MTGGISAVAASAPTCNATAAERPRRQFAVRGGFMETVVAAGVIAALITAIAQATLP